MKRYRVLGWDWDSRALILKQEIADDWEEQAKEMWRRNKKSTVDEVNAEFGTLNSEIKIQNFIDLDRKPVSVIAFHNRFFEQIRHAFVIGAYYPALTGACALGERILNHLILCLRVYFKATQEYKRIHRKDSFDDWEVAISTLESWDVLLPKTVGDFRILRKLRNKTLHFRPDVDTNDREFALEAIHYLQNIIAEQFSGFGPQPWFITGILGEIYIKKDWESNPFVKTVYLPNCLLVGPKNKVEQMIPKMVINDNFDYEDRDITDEEFVSLRNSNIDKRPS